MMDHSKLASLYSELMQSELALVNQLEGLENDVHYVQGDIMDYLSSFASVTLRRRGWVNQDNGPVTYVPSAPLEIKKPSDWVVYPTVPVKSLTAAWNPLPNWSHEVNILYRPMKDREYNAKFFVTNSSGKNHFSGETFFFPSNKLEVALSLGEDVLGDIIIGLNGSWRERRAIKKRIGSGEFVAKLRKL